MSKTEIVIIKVLFHSLGYRCLKHFYIEEICKRKAPPIPQRCIIQPIRGTRTRGGYPADPVHQKDSSWQMYRHQFY